MQYRNSLRVRRGNGDNPVAEITPWERRQSCRRNHAAGTATILSPKSKTSQPQTFVIVIVIVIVETAILTKFLKLKF